MQQFIIIVKTNLQKQDITGIMSIMNRLNGNKISDKKNIISRNRNENNNSNEKFTGKTNHTLFQNKKKNHINLNINLNNQHKVVFNKMNSGINNNSTNLCSVRSSDKKGIINIKKEKNNID